MLKETAYFYLNELKVIAKMENFVPYIYDKEYGWKVDNENILGDCLIGYDGYDIGSTDMLLKVDKISEEVAMKIIKAS